MSFPVYVGHNNPPDVTYVRGGNLKMTVSELSRHPDAWVGKCLILMFGYGNTVA